MMLCSRKGPDDKVVFIAGRGIRSWYFVSPAYICHHHDMGTFINTRYIKIEIWGHLGGSLV